MVDPPQAVGDPIRALGGRRGVPRAELARDFPEPPARGFGIVGKIAAAEEVLKALRLDAARSIEDSSIGGMLDEPSRELMDHDGTCVCGRRT